MAENLEERIKKLKQRLTLISTSLSNAVTQLKSGKIVSAATITELQEEHDRLKTHIARLEAGEEINPTPNPQPPIPVAKGCEFGIPDDFKIKRRPYTLTPDALAQRKKAAKSPNKSKGMEGNTNAYKTGEHCEGFIRQVFRPCLSTCEKYPCAIVKEGETEPGEVCLDKVNFIKTLQAVQSALKDNKLEDLKDLAALRIAGGFEVVQRLISEVLEDGATLYSEKYDKEGKLLMRELKNHPVLPFLAKLMEVLNLTPQDMMITPLIIRKQKTEAKKAQSLAGIISGIGSEKSKDEEDD